MMQILVFQNLNIAVFDDQGNSVPELQRVSLVHLLARHLEENGYDPRGATVENNEGIWRITKTEEGVWIRELA